MSPECEWPTDFRVGEGSGRFLMHAHLYKFSDIPIQLCRFIQHFKHHFWGILLWLRMGSTIPPETTKKTRQINEITVSRDYQARKNTDPWATGSKWGEPYNCSSSLPEGQPTSWAQEGRTQAEPSRRLKLRRWSRRCAETTRARVCRTEHCRWGNCGEKTPEICTFGHTEEHMHASKLPEARERTTQKD